MALPKDTKESYDIVKSFARKSDGKFDYDAMHPALKKQEKYGPMSRDLSVAVSALTEVLKDVIARLEALEAK